MNYQYYGVVMMLDWLYLQVREFFVDTLQRGEEAGLSVEYRDSLLVAARRWSQKQHSDRLEKAVEISESRVLLTRRDTRHAG